MTPNILYKASEPGEESVTHGGLRAPTHTGTRKHVITAKRLRQFRRIHPEEHKAERTGTG